MFSDEFSVRLAGKRLFIDYFKGNVWVDNIESKEQAYKYIMKEVAKLDSLKQRMLSEADKFVNE